MSQNSGAGPGFHQESQEPGSLSDGAIDPRWSRISTVFFVACFILIGYLLYSLFRSFFGILIWATVLTVVFYPLYNQILKLTRQRRGLAAVLSCFLILILIIIPVTILGVLISRQAISLYDSVQASMNQKGGGITATLLEFQRHPWVQRALFFAESWLGVNNVDLPGLVRQTANAAGEFAVKLAPSVLVGVGGLIYRFLMVFITMFFLFRDGPSIGNSLRTLSPLPQVYDSEIFKKFEDVSYATIFGSILTAVVQGCAGALLFWLMGIHSPLFWGAVVSFVSLVPVVGASLVWVPVSVYLMLSGHLARGIVLLAIGSLAVSSIDNILKPAIIHGRTNMHPLLVFFSVLGGIETFGLLGVLLGPLVVALFLSFLNFYKMRFSSQFPQKDG